MTSSAKKPYVRHSHIYPFKMQKIVVRDSHPVWLVQLNAERLQQLIFYWNVFCCQCRSASSILFCQRCSQASAASFMLHHQQFIHQLLGYKLRSKIQSNSCTIYNVTTRLLGLVLSSYQLPLLWLPALLLIKVWYRITSVCSVKHSRALETAIIPCNIQLLNPQLLPGQRWGSSASRITSTTANTSTLNYPKLPTNNFTSFWYQM